MRNKLSIHVGLIILVFILSAGRAFADHLKGGWIKYAYIGKSGSDVQYQVTFYQYSDCSEPEKVDPGIFLGIFYGGTSNYVKQPQYIPRTNLTTEQKSDFGPCFQNAPHICYLVAEYSAVVTVPENQDGFVLSVQRCCRIQGIANVPNSNSTGLTYTITIPGSSSENNNSPVFDFNDAAAICYGTFFTFDFSAKDIDGDVLTYSLCSGLTGGTQLEPVVTEPSAPPFQTIPYFSPYNGKEPLGGGVTINAETGELSGIAPSQTGTYVVAVCVSEYRNGVIIANTRKELHLDVSNCKLGGAQLDPSYITCDGFDFTFINKAGNNPDYYYTWDFGVTNTLTDTSTRPTPTYIFPDTGTYTVHLKARNDAGCEDEAQTEVKIYPGFTANFSVNGSCIKNPYNFTDLTTTKYGYVNSWQWFFGDIASDGSADDTAQNPLYTYTDTGQKTITLITTNSKGCVDTAVKVLQIYTGPDLSMKFRDTLICSIDTLRLKSSSTTEGAIFNWSPGYNILGNASNQPLVYPKQTTTYNVVVDYKGCVASDSVTVHVIDKVNLELPPDTTICKTDSIFIQPETNALYFSWTPAQALNSSVVKSPYAVPLSNTTYSLTASVGKCFATGKMNVNVVPYPAASAGLDGAICFGKTIALNANIVGSNFTWSPESSLYNAKTLSPIAGPQSTTSYILYVTDTLGCPKPATDTVEVTVIPKIIAFAGNDTTVVRTQPLQLNATGGSIYEWAPSSNLSNAFIANPVAVFNDGPDTITYNVKVSTPEGCFSSDSIKIYIFKTEPQVFIPTAFTPNGDGRNDMFRPTVAGMKQFYYLRIYNRWGQLLYNTGTPEKGWDGTYNGNKQAAGTYVYVIEAKDYTDKSFLKKGTFVLIR